jgi:hypothetical protein
VDRDEALRATLDFGQAIKDLAAAEIFPGDMLVKNFGVTRHGRVIFYDYDEVAPLLRCNFRHQPRAPTPKPSSPTTRPTTSGPDDVFPEEWRAFLGPPGPSATPSTAPTPSSSTPIMVARRPGRPSAPARSWTSTPTPPSDRPLVLRLPLVRLASLLE